MHRRREVAILVLLIAVAASAFAVASCGDTTTTSAPQTTTPSLVPSVGYLDPQSVELEDITNLDLAWLTEDEQQVLAQQSFVAVGLPAGESAQKFWSIYENARYQGLPVLVTTDSLLNAYHNLFDMLLQRMEEASLFDQAMVMTQELHSAAYDQWDTVEDQTVKADAWLNRAYFAVAAALLDPSASVPAELQELVEQETSLIYGAAGLSESPLLGYVEDYSQYKVRGHYTRSERLQRYFRAMMWYGHTGFFINPREPDVTREEAVGLTRRAMLISLSLTGTAKEAWRAIYEPTSYLVGKSDDLGAEDIQRAVAQVYGSAQPDLDDLGDQASIDSVREALNELPAPKILSAAVPDLEDDSDGERSREEEQRSFRVMGQRYLPDSYAFQQLVWEHVGTLNNKRTLPLGLDVMSVLGSAEAYRLATELYGQQQYADWSSQIRKVEQEFSTLDPEVWPRNLYTGWLESLQQVMAMPPEEAPAFMRTRPWALKSLNAALASWAELRHDTLLYAKQSVTAEGEGGEEPLSPGYVEPYPDFYSSIAELTDSLRQELDYFDLLDIDSAEKLDRMVYLAEALATISRKELAGSSLTEEEISLIQTYGQELESLEQFGRDAQGLALSPGPAKTPVVADVHTDLISAPNQVLEEATGYPLLLYAAIESDGSLQLFVGASYAYYEFTAPLDRRLTDEEWTALLDSGDNPPRPEWTDTWIMQR